MKILLDSANLNDVSYFYEHFPVVGVTTNPTILAQEKGDIVSHLLKIRQIITDKSQLHVQLTELSYDKMIVESFAIANLLGDNTFIKIPVSDIGLRVIKTLTEKGLKSTATAILTPTQALLAARAGASYVAPYVSRLDNILGDGIENVAQIAQIFGVNNINTEILAASFKTAKQVLEAALAGSHCATVGSDLMHYLSAHPITTSSIEKFDKDFKSAFGGSTLLELIFRKNNVNL